MTRGARVASMNTLRLEALFGTRWLLRDNWLCERMVRNLRRHEAMSREEMEALSLASLHKTLTAAITGCRITAVFRAIFQWHGPPKCCENAFRS